jgi:hypothetical protein
MPKGAYPVGRVASVKLPASCADLKLLSKTSTVPAAKFAARRKVPVVLVATAMSVYAAFAAELLTTVTACGVLEFQPAILPSRLPKRKVAEPLLGMLKMLVLALKTVPAGTPWVSVDAAGGMVTAKALPPLASSTREKPVPAVSIQNAAPMETPHGLMRVGSVFCAGTEPSEMMLVWT